MCWVILHSRDSHRKKNGTYAVGYTNIRYQNFDVSSWFMNHVLLDTIRFNPNPLLIDAVWLLEQWKSTPGKERDLVNGVVEPLLAPHEVLEVQSK